MNTDISERYRAAAALSVRVIVFHRIHICRRSYEIQTNADAFLRADRVHPYNPGPDGGGEQRGCDRRGRETRMVRTPGQGTQKEEASRSVGDSC